MTWGAIGGFALSAAPAVLGAVSGNKGQSGTGVTQREPAPKDYENQWLSDEVFGYLDKLAKFYNEDEAASKAADERAIGSVSDILDAFQSQASGILGDYTGTANALLNQGTESQNFVNNLANAIIPEQLGLTRDAYGRMLTDRESALADQSVQRELANRKPVNLSFGNFSMPFTTGTQRNATRENRLFYDVLDALENRGLDIQDQALRTGQFGLDTQATNLNTRNSMQNLINDVLGARMGVSEGLKADDLALINMILNSEQTHTPNASNLRYLERLLPILSEYEDRRYSIPTETTTGSTPTDYFGMGSDLISNLTGTGAFDWLDKILVNDKVENPSTTPDKYKGLFG